MSGRSSAGRAGAAPGPEALGEPPVAIADDGDQRLGETIRLMRQRAGLSIQEVAKRTGLSSGMISQVERALATPSVRTLRLLSIALGVPISYFFEEHEPVSPARYIVRKK